MINARAFAQYVQVEILLRAVLRHLRAKRGMKLDHDPRDPSTFNYGKLWKHVLNICATSDAPALLETDRLRTGPGISLYSIPGGVPLPRIRELEKLPAIPNKETQAPL